MKNNKYLTKSRFKLTLECHAKLFSTGKNMYPNKKLTPIFENIDNELLESLIIEEETRIQDCGATMMAYAQIQFTQMGIKESTQVKNALLIYCELGTLAMVMLRAEWIDGKFELTICH